MNIIEKGLAKKAQVDTVMPGDRITVVPDALMISSDNILSILEEFSDLGYEKIHQASGIFITVKSNSINEEINFFVAKYGAKLLARKNDLQSHQALLKEKVIISVEKEIGEYGAFGAIPLKVSPATMVKCLGTGKIELTVPETVYIEMNGSISGSQKVERLCDYLNDYFNDSLIGSGIILGGEIINQLDEGAKRRLTSFLYELGGALATISSSGPFGQVESVVKIRAHQIPGINRV